MELKEILTTVPLEPHSKLNEKDIANQLGISATH
ncbi:MAG: DNA-binding GntR family transcriptional regulator [Clostridium sp.]|jgi:DNA-binding GntR family transcriptional regulator